MISQIFYYCMLTSYYEHCSTQRYGYIHYMYGGKTMMANEVFENGNDILIGVIVRFKSKEETVSSFL